MAARPAVSGRARGTRNLLSEYAARARIVRESPYPRLMEFPECRMRPDHNATPGLVYAP
ncbi:hypothetical protein Ntsu_54080 [Nocardia sp. IFM 10818]